MKKSKNQVLLKIFINENERCGKLPLHEWILKRALEEELSVLTVIRGVEGINTEHKVSTAKIMDISLDLPLLIEIIDKKKKIQKFVKLVEEVIKEGVIALQDVKAEVYLKK